MTDSADSQKTLLVSRRHYVNTKYKVVYIIPRHDCRTQFCAIVFRSNKRSFTEIRIDLWFYPLVATPLFAGVGNLANVQPGALASRMRTGRASRMCGIRMWRLVNSDAFDGYNMQEKLTIVDRGISAYG